MRDHITSNAFFLSFYNYTKRKNRKRKILNPSNDSKLQNDRIYMFIDTFKVNCYSDLQKLFVSTVRTATDRSRFRNKIYTLQRSESYDNLPRIGRREGGGVKWKRENYVVVAVNLSRARDKKEGGREMPARSRSFLLFHPPLSSSRISVGQNRSSNEEEARLLLRLWN